MSNTTDPGILRTWSITSWLVGGTLILAIYTDVAFAASPRSISRATIQWENVPLGAALDRLSETVRIPIFLDRRIDPSQRISLIVRDEPVDQILQRLTAERHLGVAWLDSLAYVGPEHVTRILPAQAELRRSEVRRLAGPFRSALEQRGECKWPRLSEPRNVVTKAVGATGIQLADAKRIPFDLWLDGSLPDLSLTDRLTVLLAGFDLTFRTLPDLQTIEIVPVTAPAPPALEDRLAAGPEQRRETDARDAHIVQRYSLRVAEQPLGKVMDQLSAQLEINLEIDERSLNEAGLSLDRRVSFQVEDADLDLLLTAVLEPAGLDFTRQGKRVRVFAQRYAGQVKE